MLRSTRDIRVTWEAPTPILFSPARFQCTLCVFRKAGCPALVVSLDDQPSTNLQSTCSHVKPIKGPCRSLIAANLLQRVRLRFAVSAISTISYLPKFTRGGSAYCFCILVRSCSAAPKLLEFNHSMRPKHTILPRPWLWMVLCKNGSEPAGLRSGVAASLVGKKVLLSDLIPKLLIGNQKSTREMRRSKTKLLEMPQLLWRMWGLFAAAYRARS